jgi:hypothetical protein
VAGRIVVAQPVSNAPGEVSGLEARDHQGSGRHRGSPGQNPLLTLYLTHGVFTTEERRLVRIDHFHPRVRR